MFHFILILSFDLKRSSAVKSSSFLENEPPPPVLHISTFISVRHLSVGVLILVPRQNPSYEVLAVGAKIRVETYFPSYLPRSFYMRPLRDFRNGNFRILRVKIRVAMDIMLCRSLKGVDINWNIGPGSGIACLEQVAPTPREIDSDPPSV